MQGQKKRIPAAMVMCETEFDDTKIKLPRHHQSHVTNKTITKSHERNYKGWSI